MTLGTLSESQAQRLANAGLGLQPQLDTAPSFTAISSPPALIRNASIRWKKCAMPGSKSVLAQHCKGETVKDRAGLLLQLANLPTPPESVPINMLVKVERHAAGG